MIKKLFTKYILEVIPSIVATVVGAYIVTHYINAKSDADKPKAAVSAPAEAPKQTARDAPAAKKPARTDEAKSVEAKATDNKAADSKAAVDAKPDARAARTEPAVAPEKFIAPPEKAAETGMDARKHQPPMKAAKSAPTEAMTPATAEEKRDANDLARAAIERLRGAEPRPSESRQSESRPVEAARQPDAPRAAEPPRVEETRQQDKVPERPRVNSVVYAPAVQPQPPAMQPLPPAVTIAPANVEPTVPLPEVRADDAARLTPPADIPSRPLELHARPARGSVADDVVSAARSVFQAVVPSD